MCSFRGCRAWHGRFPRRADFCSQIRFALLHFTLHTTSFASHFPPPGAAAPPAPTSVLVVFLGSRRLLSRPQSKRWRNASARTSRRQRQRRNKSRCVEERRAKRRSRNPARSVVASSQSAKPGRRNHSRVVFGQILPAYIAVYLFMVRKNSTRLCLLASVVYCIHVGLAGALSLSHVSKIMPRRPPCPPSNLTPSIHPFSTRIDKTQQTPSISSLTTRTGKYDLCFFSCIYVKQNK